MSSRPFSIMAPCIPNHIAYCRIQGRTALLDVRRDRYFGVPASLEAAFSRLAAGDGISASELERLKHRGLAAEGTREPFIEPIAVGSSHPEDAPCGPGAMAELYDVGRALAGARRMVTRRPFEAVVARLRARAVRSEQVETTLLEATDRFLATRPLVPIRPICLQDSVALIDYLAPRGFHPRLVFGVALAPFSAHCWVQVGEVILNDALLRARAHTPILAV